MVSIRKRIVALLLLLVLVTNMLIMSGCAEPPPVDPPVEPATPDGIDDLEKYADIELSEAKLNAALEAALLKIDYAIETLNGKFPSNNSKNNVYSSMNNTKGWWTGFWTGILWHAYELSGEDKYKELASSQIQSYYDRIENQIGVNHHDMGFLYSPSCVAAYMLTGDEKAKEAAIMAADHLITRYHPDSGFIQAWGNVGDEEEFRLIVDCLLNIPLLYWAREVTGERKYASMAYEHFKTSMKVCYREDGSTYHTYYFDAKTGEPLRGATAQGAGDETTWSRGQAWGMYGPLLTYCYVKDELALTSFKKAANYYLNNLPEDYVAFWDLSYSDGDDQPRDSSSAAIAVCALLESAKHLSEDDPYRAVYVNAAKRIMNSLIDSYTTKDVPEANGLLLHGTNSMSAGAGIDEMTIWGDYFYIEALHRFLDPEWEMYW